MSTADYTHSPPASTDAANAVVCPACQGAKGKWRSTAGFAFAWERCKACDGTGYAPHLRRLDAMKQEGTR